ncbi:MAG: hypothetical protein ACREMF_07355 [Gemmatimonadales bacterium]
MIARVQVLRQAVPLCGLLLTGTRLAAQTVTASAVIANPKSSVRLGGVTDRGAGLWAGVAFDLQVGRFEIRGSGMRGRLTPGEAGAAPDRDVGETSFGLGYAVRPWLGFELQYTARAFRSAAGRQRWDMLGVSASARHDLGIPDVRAFAALVYLPIVTLSDQKGPSFAFGSEVGIFVAPSRTPLVVQLSYGVQRFRFPATTGRSEQFETLTLSVGARVRRLDGRWRLGG